MYLNRKALVSLKILEEATKNKNSGIVGIVGAWSRKYNINKKDLEIIWRRAELLAIKSKKGKCIPWGLVVDIFKSTVRKYFKNQFSSKIETEDKKAKEAKKDTLNDIDKRRYKTEIKNLEKEFPNSKKIPDCIRGLT